jgi:protein-S-isoprenylcysteine O-methyltransferase Ste14
MFSLLLRNIFFTIIHPGVVAGLIPYWILGDRVYEEFAKPFALHQYVAVVAFLIGLAILLSCIAQFAVDGRGTLSPADPTKRLVIKGLYKYTRNPMYVGVTLMLIGELVFFSSVNLLLYALFVFFCFNLFILFVEEPRLKKDFTSEYLDYCKQVRRWI